MSCELFVDCRNVWRTSSSICEVLQPQYYSTTQHLNTTENIRSVFVLTISHRVSITQSGTHPYIYIYILKSSILLKVVLSVEKMSSEAIFLMSPTKQARIFASMADPKAPDMTQQLHSPHTVCFVLMKMWTKTSSLYCEDVWNMFFSSTRPQYIVCVSQAAVWWP